jgi:hypothetical protein
MKGRHGKIRSLSFFNSQGEKRRIPCRVFDARDAVSFSLVLDHYLIMTSDKGVPWNCLLARGCKRHNNHFPHKVLEAYANGSALYVQTTSVNRAGQVPTFIRYRHNFTRKLRKFDVFSRTQFLKLFGNVGVELELLPPRPASKASPRDRDRADAQPRPRQGQLPGLEKAVRRGAYRRALDAGLLFETQPSAVS